MARVQSGQKAHVGRCRRRQDATCSPVPDPQVTGSAMADGASSADPYASQKNNIRDTVKYMAAAYAACGTVIFTGISLSGLGSLPLERLLPALLTGFAAIASVFAAIESIVDMLIGDFSFPSTLDGAARRYIDQNATDLLP